MARCRLAAAPTIRTGRLDAIKSSTARSIAFCSAMGRRNVDFSKMRFDVISLATSSASSTWTGPGFSVVAAAKARRTVAANMLPLATDLVNFVMGFIISTTSIIWKLACLLSLMGFWPVRKKQGKPPKWANAAGVVKFVAPAEKQEGFESTVGNVKERANLTYLALVW